MTATRAAMLALGLCGACGASAEPPPVTSGWQTLIQRPWSLAPGTEGYVCTRLAAPQDLWVRGFRQLAPRGTHHVTVTLSPPGAALGDVPCETGNLEPAVLYSDSSTAGTWTLPDGVGVRVRAGQLLHLNLHLVNAMNEPATGTSGLLVDVSAADLHEADLGLFSLSGFSVPARRTGYVVTGSCAVRADQQALFVWPHMHRRGAYLRAEVLRGASSDVLYDGLYAFDEQRAFALDPRWLRAGDEVRLQCTYNNLTSAPLAEGPLADDEMCVLGLYRQPALGAGGIDCQGAAPP